MYNRYTSTHIDHTHNYYNVTFTMHDPLAWIHN
jgi:hypothetical protein